MVVAIQHSLDRRTESGRWLWLTEGAFGRCRLSDGSADAMADADCESNPESVADRAGMGEPFRVEDDFVASTTLNDSGLLGATSSAVESGTPDAAGHVVEHDPEPRTGRYDLRKRPRAVAHRTWVEEEPMDSADPVSYRKPIEHPRLGPRWADAVNEELRSLDENSTWEHVWLEDVLAGVTPISSNWDFRPARAWEGNRVSHTWKLLEIFSMAMPADIAAGRT